MMKDPNWQKCVLNADSRDVIKRIPDNSIDFILTDPPYNLGQHSTGNIPLPGRSAMNNDVADWDMIDFNPEEWVDDLIRILKPTGNLFIFTSYNQLGRWYNCLDHKFDTSNFMIWHKTNPAPKIFKAGFLNSCEMIFTCWNKKHTWNFISQAEMHNFIESPICMRPERLSSPKHPTQKPVAILKKMIEIASNENDIVFDPFMGVGSTGVAALSLGRRFIGVEINKDYYQAGKKRIENELIMNGDLFRTTGKKEYAPATEEEIGCGVVGEVALEYQRSYPSLDYFFSVVKGEKSEESEEQKASQEISTGLSPIIKWPGGKESEIHHILSNAPRFNRFFEPFVGGGSVFMGLKAREYFINDFSSELIALYRNIASSDKHFFDYVEAIDSSWKKANDFFISSPVLAEYFKAYRRGKYADDDLKQLISNFCKVNEATISSIVANVFNERGSILISEMQTNLYRKMVRMRKIEKEKHELPDSDLDDNIETAIKSAVYMNYRNLYNRKDIEIENPQLHCALFFFIRNYAYSGMFRYSKNGDFNVPYGGIAYNSKRLAKKINYYRSFELLDHFRDTSIFNEDFEVFLRRVNPTEDDFVFLDPPYDSEFSTYAQNAFTRKD